MRFYEAKLKMLEKLLIEVLSENNNQILEKAFAPFLDIFSYEDAVILLAMDDKYRSGFYTIENNHSIFNYQTSGGLSWMIALISDIEYEMTCNIGRKMREVLAPLNNLAVRSELPLSVIFYSSCYKHPQVVEIFENALELYNSEKEEKRQHYHKFSTRLTELFGNLSETFNYNREIITKAKNKKILEKALQNIIPHIISSIELTGEPPDLASIFNQKAIAGEKKQDFIDFIPNDDYTVFSHKGLRYFATINQAVIIKILHEAFLNGSPFVQKEKIFEALAHPPDHKMSHKFQNPNGRLIWENVIDRSMARRLGQYALKL